MHHEPLEVWDTSSGRGTYFRATVILKRFPPRSAAQMAHKPENCRAVHLAALSSCATGASCHEQPSQEAHSLVSFTPSFHMCLRAALGKGPFRQFPAVIPFLQRKALNFILHLIGFIIPSGFPACLVSSSTSSLCQTPNSFCSGLLATPGSSSPFTDS